MREQEFWDTTKDLHRKGHLFYFLNELTTHWSFSNPWLMLKWNSFIILGDDKGKYRCMGRQMHLKACLLFY